MLGTHPRGKFGSTYDGIYWDPATQPDAPDAQPGAAPDAPGAPDVYFRGFKAKAPTVQSLRIYEAHVAWPVSELGRWREKGAEIGCFLRTSQGVPVFVPWN